MNKILSMGLAPLILGAPPPVAAQPPEPSTANDQLTIEGRRQTHEFGVRRVYIGDPNLRSSDGENTIYKRVRSAASHVCWKDANIPVGLQPHAAFQSICDAKRVSDAPNVFMAPLVGEDRMHRRRIDVGQARQQTDQFVGQPIGEIFHVGKRREIDEGQHGNRIARRRDRARTCRIAVVRCTQIAPITLTTHRDQSTGLMRQRPPERHDMHLQGIVFNKHLRLDRHHQFIFGDQLAGRLCQNRQRLAAQRNDLTVKKQFTMRPEAETADDDFLLQHAKRSVKQEYAKYGSVRLWSTE